MIFGRRDERDPLIRALEAAASLKIGTWESVMSYAMLAVEANGSPEADVLYDRALEASRTLQSGSQASIQALTWLARASRELGR